MDTATSLMFPSMPWFDPENWPSEEKVVGTPWEGEVRYEIEITGNVSPFKWHLNRIPKGVSKSSAGKSGEAETRELAILDGSSAAEDAHREWVHRSTKEVVVVYEVKPRAPAPSADELEKMFSTTTEEPNDH